ncbi:MAG: hypothetical protein Q4F56_02595, partial [Candidatus Saccharibacteria bacterium]|nr:hypothetical protein [Candidatus Saccharibacteria bacterium]
LNSRPIGFYWSASVYSATHSRSLGFDTSGTARSLYPQSYNGKGLAFAVRCVGAGSGGVVPLNNFVMWL